MKTQKSRAVGSATRGAATTILFTSIAAAVAAPATPNSVPPKVLAVLEEHIGRWRSEGTLVVGGVPQRAEATWECTHAGLGITCEWQHTWPDGHTDTAREVAGYDPILNTVTFARVTDQGVIRTAPNELRGNTLYYRWESTQDGKPLVGVNEVFMQPGAAQWTQRMTIDVAGARVTELNVTHHRVR